MPVNRLHIAAMVLCLHPAVAWSSPADCPDLEQVLSTITTPQTRLDARLLADKAGAAAQDEAELSDLAQEIRLHVPGVSDAEVVDILTASYCRYLVTSGSDVDISASLADFEKVAYGSVFGDNAQNRVFVPKRPHGWLYSK